MLYKFDYSDGDLVYVGINKDSSAADGKPTWEVYKMDWLDGNLVKARTRTISWASRTSGW